MNTDISFRRRPLFRQLTAFVIHEIVVHVKRRCYRPVRFHVLPNGRERQTIRVPSCLKKNNNNKEKTPLARYVSPCTSDTTHSSDDRPCSRSSRRHNTCERNGDFFRTVGRRTSLLPLDGADTEALCTAGIPVTVAAFLYTR